MFEQIEILLGQEASASLLKQLGGRKIYVRVKPAESAGDAITDAIGLAASRILSRVFGGSWVTLPVGRALEWRRGRSARQARIVAMFEQGAHPGEIASALQCSERYVYKVLNGK